MISSRHVIIVSHRFAVVFICYLDLEILSIVQNRIDHTTDHPSGFSFMQGLGPATSNQFYFHTSFSSNHRVLLSFAIHAICSHPISPHSQTLNARNLVISHRMDDNWNTFFKQVHDASNFLALPTKSVSTLKA